MNSVKFIITNVTFSLAWRDSTTFSVYVYVCVCVYVYICVCVYVCMYVYVYILYIYRVIQNYCRGVNDLSYTIHIVLQMQPHVISFYEITSRIRFMFFLFPQVSRN